MNSDVTFVYAIQIWLVTNSPNKGDYMARSSDLRVIESNNGNNMGSHLDQ